MVDVVNFAPCFVSYFSLMMFAVCKRTSLPEGAVDFQYNLFFFLHRDEKANGTLIFPLPVVTRWEEKPVGVLPPSQRPSFANSIKLSWIRSVRISRSNSAIMASTWMMILDVADPRIDIVGADQKRHIVTLKVFQKPA